MRPLMILTGLLALAGTAAPAQDRALPLMECRSVPSLCAASVQAYLDGPATGSPEFPGTLGILAAHLSRMPVDEDSGPAIAAALRLVADAMRRHDADLADRIEVVATARLLRGSAPDDTAPVPRSQPPLLSGPVFASPS